MKSKDVILFVDDELMVRKTGKRILTRLGYEVILAENGEKAVSLFRENKDSISLVLLDMIMPGIRGQDTFGKLRNIDPAVKVLISSGYPEHEDIGQMLSKGPVSFMQKPYNLAQLSREVEALIA